MKRKEGGKGRQGCGGEVNAPSKKERLKSWSAPRQKQGGE